MFENAVRPELRDLDEDLTRGVELPPTNRVLRDAAPMNWTRTAATAAVLAIGSLGGVTVIAQSMASGLASLPIPAALAPALRPAAPSLAGPPPTVAEVLPPGQHLSAASFRARTDRENTPPHQARAPFVGIPEPDTGPANADSYPTWNVDDDVRRPTSGWPDDHRDGRLDRHPGPHPMPGGPGHPMPGGPGWPRPPWTWPGQHPGWPSSMEPPVRPQAAPAPARTGSQPPAESMPSEVDSIDPPAASVPSGMRPPGMGSMMPPAAGSMPPGMGSVPNPMGSMTPGMGSMPNRPAPVAEGTRSTGTRPAVPPGRRSAPQGGNGNAGRQSASTSNAGHQGGGQSRGARANTGHQSGGGHQGGGGGHQGGGHAGGGHSGGGHGGGGHGGGGHGGGGHGGGGHGGGGHDGGGGHGH